MWDFHPTPSFEQSMSSLINVGLCSTFEDSIDMGKLGHDSDTMLDEHDSPQ